MSLRCVQRFLILWVVACLLVLPLAEAAVPVTCTCDRMMEESMPCHHQGMASRRHAAIDALKVHHNGCDNSCGSMPCKHLHHVVAAVGHCGQTALPVHDRFSLLSLFPPAAPEPAAHRKPPRV